MTEKNEIIECEAKPLVESNKSIAPIDISGLLTKVIDKGPDAIKMLEGLLELQDKQQKRLALAEFNKAKARCQSELPSVKKTREVWNKGRTAVTYRYATLDDARKACLSVISDNGFSDGWKTENQDRGTLITYSVRHDLGHEESTSMFCPMEQSKYMNAIQRSGSTITYGKRYTFCDFWGIVLDEDDDGRGNGPKGNETPKQQSNTDIDPVERDKAAIKWIDHLVKDASRTEDWEGYQIKVDSAAWMLTEHKEYFNKLKSEWKDSSHPEDDLPF